MREGIDVALVLPARIDHDEKVGRLVATNCTADEKERWSAEAGIFRDQRTGGIRLGRPEVDPTMPRALASVLQDAIRRAWHHESDARAVGPGSRALSEEQVKRKLQLLAAGGDIRSAT